MDTTTCTPMNYTLIEIRHGKSRWYTPTTNRFDSNSATS